MNRILCILLGILFFVPLSSIAQRPTDSVMTAQRDTLRKTFCPALVITYPRPWLQDLPVSVFTRCLDGAIPGLQSTNGGGQPGSSPELLIRGIGSYNTDNAPLLLLNGAAYSGNIAYLNVQDIDHITVLKDAAATVIYGNRAANGVLDVVTKGSVSYRNRLNIDVKSGIVTRGIRDYDKLQAKDYYETIYNALAGTPDATLRLLGGYNAYNVPDNQLFTPEGKINPNASLKYEDDWVKETQRIGFRQDYNIATSGAGARGSYYFATGYLNEKGYIKSTGFERWNATFHGSIKVFSWLKAGIFATTAVGSQHFIDPGNTMNNPFYVARFMPPVFPVYYRNADGAREVDPVTGKDKYDWGNTDLFPSSSMGNRLFASGVNSAGSLAMDNRQNKFNAFLVNPYLEIKFLKQFTYKAGFHYNYNNNKQLVEYNPYYGDGVSTGGRLSTLLTKDKIYTLNESLTWKPAYTDHHPEVVAGHEAYEANNNFTSQTTYGPGRTSTSGAGTYYYNVEGFYLNGMYNFKEKYYLSAGIRRDQTSQLGPQLRWGNYWAIGAAYDLSNENFMKYHDWINTLKMRASYGIQGNSGFALYKAPAAEKIRQLNLGIDFYAFNNRLNINLDVYHKNNPSSILTMPPSHPAGFPYFADMQIKNQGLELAIATDIVREYNKIWSIRLNATHNKNSITPNPGTTPSPVTSIYDLYLPGYAGPDPASGQATYYINTSRGRFTTTDYGLLTAQDWQNIGTAQPWLYGSLKNSFSYKQFDFSFQLNYSLGGKYYDQIYADLMGNGLFNGNWSPDILNRWTTQNTATDIPRISIADQYTNATSDRFVKDASYLNIKNVYLGYNLAVGRLKKAKLKALTIYLTAENLWLFTASKGMDPQASFDGMGRYGYLPARTIMLGVNVGI